MFERKSFQVNVDLHNGKNSDKNEATFGPISFDRNSLGSAKTEDGKQDKNEINKLTVSAIVGLYRYADGRDIALMVVGFICALMSGTINPIMSLIFGRMTQIFLSVDKYLKYPGFKDNNTFYDHDFGDGHTVTSSVLIAPLNTSLPNDFVTEQEFLSTVKYYSLLYLIMGVVCFILSYAQVFCWETACENQVYKLRKVYFSQIMRQDIQWFDQNEEGDLSSKLTDDFERMKYGLGSKVPMISQYTAQFIAGLCIGFHTSWKLTTILCFAGPFLLVSSAVAATVMAATAKREQLRYGIAGGIAVQALTSVRTVAAFGLEKGEINRYESALQEGRKLAMSKYYAMSLGMSLSFGMMYAAYALGFWYGSTLFLKHEIEPGKIFTVFFSVLVAAFSIGNSLPLIAEISNAIGASSNVFNIIDRVPKIDPYSEEGDSPEKVEGNIVFKNVKFSYPTRPDVQVLKGLNLEIEAGKIIALVGLSGAGKSTIVSLLMRFYDITGGQICLDGKSLDQLNLDWLRKQIGVVSQEPVLFGVSIAENIRYGHTGISEEEVINAAKLANAHNFITSLSNGYETLVGDLGTMLSGGQKQRIAIARALVRNPKILLLDEATSALDAESEKIVQLALERAMKGRTTIIIAHRLSTIRNVDVIYAMQNGVVVESGTHEGLIEQKGLYYGLIKIQSGQIKEIPEAIPDLMNPDFIQPMSKKRSGSIRRNRSRQSSIKSTNDDQVEEENDTEDSDLEVSYADILKLATVQWPLLAITLICCIISGFHLPIFSLLYSQVIQVFTLTGQAFQQASIFWTEMFCILAITIAIVYYICVLSSSIATEKLIQIMRAKTFENILSQQVCWFDKEERSPLRLTNSLAKDPPFIKSAAGMRAGIILINFITLALAFIIAFFSSWKLGLIAFSFMPFLIYSSWKQLHHRKSQYDREMESEKASSQMASECIQNIRTVQLLGLQNYMLDKFGETLGIAYKEGKGQVVYFCMSYALSQCLIFLIYSTVYYFGSIYVDEGEISFIDIYRIVFAIGFSFPSLGVGCLFLQDFIKSKAAVSYIFKLMKINSSLNTFSDDGLKPDINGRVVFKNVYFRYPTRKQIPILRGLNLVIEPGQTVALVGASGCGKSTIISLLERFYSPISGSIFVDDLDISLINICHLRSHMGLVTQEPTLFDCSIKQNIVNGVEALGKPVTDQMIIDAAKLANIHEFIISLPQGYDTLAGEKGAQLSGGQKQRIAIARALIRNPKILLLDEATSALDNESEKIVQEALDKARKGRTSIIIAHRLSSIRDADCIVVIKNGKVVEQGTHVDLKAMKGFYYDLIKIQVEKED